MIVRNSSLGKPIRLVNHSNVSETDREGTVRDSIFGIKIVGG